MRVKEVSMITGVSVRTLHHYDEIGLLIPDHVTESGYRMYSDDNLTVLQQILFFKELGFSLKRIRELLVSPTFNRQEVFQLQREMLINKRRKLDGMIELIDKTIQHGKGEYFMTNEEKFTGFDFGENSYEQEARAKWGDAAVEEANAKVKTLGTDMQEKMNRMYFNLSKLRHLAPDSTEAQHAIGEWFIVLNEMGTYSLEAFAGLGEIYVADERFTTNIDKFGEGLALFMRDAMKVYAERR